MNVKNPFPRENIRKILEELESEGECSIPQPEYSDYTIPFEGTEMYNSEYSILGETTALYGSTPEQEYKAVKIKLSEGHVTYYDLSAKKLASLPDSIGNLSGLKELLLNDNRLDKKTKEKLKDLFGSKVRL